MSEFDRPTTAIGFAPRDHPEWLGKLFLIRPNYVERITFKPEDGPKEIVNCFVVILDLQGPPDGRPVVLDGAQIGGAALVPQLKGKIDKLVLGRLEQSPATAGKSPAYKLSGNFTDADESAAKAWKDNPAFGGIPPLPQAPAPEPEQSPWAGQQQQAPVAPQAPTQQWQQPATPPPADVWAGTNAAPAQQGWAPTPAAAAPAPAAWQQPPAAPQAPAQQWGQPATAPVPATPQAPVQDPQLVAFLQSKGIAVTGDMTQETLLMIANSLGN